MCIVFTGKEKKQGKEANHRRRKEDFSERISRIQNVLQERDMKCLLYRRFI